MKNIFRILKNYYHWVAICIISTVLVMLANIALLESLKNIINDAQAGTLENIYYYLEMGILALVVGAAASYFITYATGKFGSGAIRDLKQDIVAYFAELPVTYVDKNTSGDILGRLSNDTNAIQDFIENYFAGMVYFPIMIVVFFGYLIYLNAALFVACFIIFPIIIPIIVKLSANMKSRSRSYMEYLGKTNNIVHEMVNQNSIVKAYGIEEALFNKYDDKLQKATSMAIQNDIYSYRIYPLFALGHNLPYIICYALGAYFCITGSLTLGGLIAFGGIIAKSVHPCMQLQQTYLNYKFAAASIERVFSVFDEKREDENNRVVHDINLKENNAITFSDVTFSYDEKTTVLNHLTFSAQNGKMTAVVGSSGNGKSTIVSLICGFHKISGGSIKIFGKNISEMSIQQMRGLISYVSQNNFLFPLSVYDNIAIGKKDATKEEVIEAAKKAFAHDFITGLPEGYDTVLGERGAKLSGGQMQRVAIARAFLKDCPIIILDEATSALDAQSEIFVQTAIENLDRERTVFVIAHRISTIKSADMILVLENGQVAECGTHDELIHLEGAYSKITNSMKHHLEGVN